MGDGKTVWYPTPDYETRLNGRGPFIITDRRERGMTAGLLGLGLPVGDTLLSMPRLMARGRSPRATVLALYSIAIALGGVAVALFHSDAEQTIGVMLLLTAGYIPFNRTRQFLSGRKNYLAMRAAARKAGEQFRHAQDPEATWRFVQEAVPALQASCAALTVVVRNGTVKTTEFSWGFDQAPMTLLRARFSLLGARPHEGRLELGFTDGRRTVDRDTEMAVELPCEHVHAAVQRIAARHEVEKTGSTILPTFRR